MALLDWIRIGILPRKPHYVITCRRIRTWDDRCQASGALYPNPLLLFVAVYFVLGLGVEFMLNYLAVNWFLETHRFVSPPSHC